TVGALTASLVLAPVVAVPAAVAPPAEENVVASGDNWTVTDLGSVYEIELELDEPLEIKSDAPTIEVDGVAVGFATESESGTTLTALTSDPAVADATTVEQGWFAEAGTTDEAAVPESAIDESEAVSEVETGPDAAVHGAYAYTKSIYRFGDQAIDLAGIGGIRGEVEGKI